MIPGLMGGMNRGGQLLRQMLADRPVRLYKLNEPGVGAVDRSGHYYGGYYQGSPSFSQPALSPGGAPCVKFTATTQFVDVDKRPALHPTTVASVAYWMQFSVLPGSGSGIFSQGTNGGLLSGFWTSATSFQFLVNIGGSFIAATINQQTALGTAKHHITHVYDGAHVLVYVDGSLAASAVATGAITYSNDVDDFINSYFGARYTNLTVSDMAYWAGTALTPTQALFLAQAGNYPSAVLSLAPTAYWPLSESGTLSTYQDYSPSNIAGAIGGGLVGQAAFSLVPSAPGDLAACFGTAGAVTCGSGVGIPGVNQPWTEELWVEIASNPTAQCLLIGWGANTTNEDAKLFLNTNGTIQASLFGNITVSPGSLSLNTPHLVAARWDGANLAVSIDGVTVASSPFAAAAVVANTPKIGSSGSPANSATPLLVAYAAIYPSALPDARLAQHYQAGKFDLAQGVSFQRLLVRGDV